MTETKKQRRFFKLINGEIIFGDIEALETNGQTEILITRPYTIVGSSAVPYMYNVLGISPRAIPIHPMNILWNVPLDEFEEINKAYIQATTGIVTDVKSPIISV